MKWEDVVEILKPALEDGSLTEEDFMNTEPVKNTYSIYQKLALIQIFNQCNGDKELILKTINDIKHPKTEIYY